MLQLRYLCTPRCVATHTGNVRGHNLHRHGYNLKVLPTYGAFYSMFARLRLVEIVTP